MSMRGVFVVLFSLLFLTSVGEALHVRGELQGFLGTEGVGQEMSLNATGKWPLGDVEGGWQGQWATSPQDTNYSVDWKVQLGSKEKLQLIFIGNRPHYSSEDLFRLVHKDNFGQASTALLVLTDGVQLGLLRRVPLKTLDQVDAWFCQSTLDVGPLRVRGVQLHFSGFREAGEARVIHLESAWWNWNILAGMGWQIDSGGVESQGKVLEIQKKGGLWEGRLAWQTIEPQFWSLLAKTNKYTPDRQGWQVESACKFGNLEIKFNRRQHSNLTGSREYNQLSWSLATQDAGPSVEWRLEPTKAFIMSSSGQGLEAQFDVWNGTLRCDWQQDQFNYGFRCDLQRRIVRVELRYQVGVEWRMIAKYDLLQRRKHYSLLVRHRTKTTELNFELGGYDRGNLLAGFNNPPSFRISWGWKF